MCENSTTTNTTTTTVNDVLKDGKIKSTAFNRFADYFVICGLDPDTGLEPDRFAGMYTSFYQYYYHYHNYYYQKKTCLKTKNFIK